MLEIDKKCEGCKKVNETLGCTVYLFPPRMWTLPGGCPMATNKKPVVKEATRKVNPIKASKRSKR